MKKINILLLALALLSVNVVVAQKSVKWVDAQTLTHLGKLCQTANPYHRIEVANYPELNKREAQLLRKSAGQSILFETNSKTIWVRPKFGYARETAGMPRNASCGFNLYIEKDGAWTWAASKSNSLYTYINGQISDKDKNGVRLLDRPLQIIANMDNSNKKCLIYLPLYSELMHLEIGVEEGADIKASENPFRHKIAIFGSSFTHGSCASGAGQTYPAFLQRQTGLYFCGLGMSGNSKLQPCLGRFLGGTDADAIVVDAFSNPSIKTIDERIDLFIGEIRAQRPDVPIIFLRTIHRENRNFDLKNDQREQERIDHVEKVMERVLSTYDHVYFINVKNQTGTDHETSADGIHPTSWGYNRWANAIQKPLLKIFKKYGIK